MTLQLVSTGVPLPEGHENLDSPTGPEFAPFGVEGVPLEPQMMSVIDGTRAAVARAEGGLYLKARREMIGLVQKQLAERLEVSTGFLSHIENGRINPPASLYRRLSVQLRVNSQSLFAVGASCMLTIGLFTKPWAESCQLNQ